MILTDLYAMELLITIFKLQWFLWINLFIKVLIYTSREVYWSVSKCIEDLYYAPSYITKPRTL